MASIKTAIELEDRVSKPLADISRTMEVTARQINNIGTSGPTAAASGLNQYFVSMKNATSAGDEHVRSVSGLTTGYRVLNLALREAGFQMGGFRALSMAANTGVAGLSVAIGATILIALAKLSDAAAEVKQRLIDMVGQDMGAKLAAQFKQSENASGSAAGSMAAAAEALLRAVEASKNANGQWQTSAGSLKNLGDVTRIWSEQIQLGKVNADEAAKSVNTIFQAMSKLQTVKPEQVPSLTIITDPETGLAEFKTVMATVGEEISKAQGLTLELFNQIEQTSPGLGRALSKAFGFSDIQAFRAELSLAPKDIEDVVAATLRMGPEVDKLFENLDARAQTAGQAAVKFKNEVGNAFEELTPQINPVTAGMSVLADALATARKEAKQSADDVTTFNAQWETLMFDLKSPPPGNWGAALGRQLDELIAKARELMGALSGGAGRGSGQVSSFSYFEPPGGATGGLFWGANPGTDANLAWLTRFEYIMNPAAVRKYGVNFMHMINSLQFPIRGFADGGLNLAPVGISSPSISAMQSSRSLTLVLDTKRFNISGSKSTIDALEREAAMRGLAATGPAPGWVR